MVTFIFAHLIAASLAGWLGWRLVAHLPAEHL